MSQKHKAFLNLMYSAWWLKTAISQELKQVGLTQEQYNVLRILKGKHPENMCIRDIGSRMIEPSSNVPRIIDRLVTKDLVSRSNSIEDKRETIIGLTDKGLTILVAASEHLNQKLDNAISMNEEDAAELNTLLEKLRSE